MVSIIEAFVYLLECYILNIIIVLSLKLLCPTLIILFHKCFSPTKSFLISFHAKDFSNYKIVFADTLIIENIINTSCSCPYIFVQSSLLILLLVRNGYIEIQFTGNYLMGNLIPRNNKSLERRERESSTQFSTDYRDGRFS